LRRLTDNMHELAVTEGILKVALEAAAQADAPRIHAIDLVIGDLSGMVDDSIQFYFDILSRDTAAAGAMLRFRREPAQVDCAECGGQFAAQPPLTPICPGCGGVRLRVVGGRELRVESIEVEDKP